MKKTTMTNHNNNNLIPEYILNMMMKDKKVRREIVRENFMMFFHFYFSHYIKYPTADFHKEIMHHLNQDKEDLYVISFRNSAKSTIITTAFPIWALFGTLQKRFILIICQTKEQARLHMASLKQELESNTLLKKDLGPFKEESNEWNAGSLKFSHSGAKIMIASPEQSIRGIRNSESRPDLILLDDVEDIASTKTRDSRNKLYQWFKGELIPAGDRNTRLVMVGNLLHEDSLLQRIKQEIDDEVINGKFMFIPLLKSDGTSTWPGKYPTQQDILNEEKKIGNDIAWRREFLLEIVPSDEQVIQREWIKRYDELPTSNISGIRIAIDLAFSEKETADYTAIICCITVGYGQNMKTYIMPEFIFNERMNAPRTIDKCKELDLIFREKYPVYPDFYVESVGAQKGIVQIMQQAGLDAEEVPSTVDKRARLNFASILVQNERILFPQQGSEILEDQIVNFGIEKYDDLADALSILARSIVDDPKPFIGIA